MGQQLIAEVFGYRQQEGEPLATVAGDEARVLAKAQRLAVKRREVLVVIAAGGTARWVVGRSGAVMRLNTQEGGDD